MNNSALLCFDQFPDHTRPTQSEVEQNSVILTCTILPGSHLRAFRSLIIVHDPIWRRNLGRRRSVNSKRSILRVLVQLHRLQLHGNTHRSCTQFVFLVRIGRVFEHAALRHLLFFGNVSACWEAYHCRRNHRITHIEIQEIVHHNESRCHKIVYWLCYLNFFDP